MDSRKTLWISYTALSDFDKCKRAYYYKHLYRNPRTNFKIQVVNPYLTLGTAVHQVLEGLAVFSPLKRKEVSLIDRYDEVWEDCRGKKGGFVSDDQEKSFKKRGEEMLERAKNSTIIKNKALDMDNLFPKLSLFRGVDLVGSIDWVEILSSGELHIVDFKTGKNEENNNSLQLPIYLLLAKENFDKKTKKASYFYLNKNKEPTPQKVDTLSFYLEKIKKKANEILNTVDRGDFSCSSGYKNCFHCREFDMIFNGSAECVGFDERMKKELYYIVKEETVLERISGGDFLSEFQKDIFEMKMKGEETKKISTSLKSPSSLIEKETILIKEKLKENLSNKELKVFIRKIGR